MMSYAVAKRPADDDGNVSQRNQSQHVHTTSGDDSAVRERFPDSNQPVDSDQ